MSHSQFANAAIYNEILAFSNYFIVLIFVFTLPIAKTLINVIICKFFVILRYILLKPWWSAFVSAYLIFSIYSSVNRNVDFVVIYCLNSLLDWIEHYDLFRFHRIIEIMDSLFLLQLPVYETLYSNLIFLTMNISLFG